MNSLRKRPDTKPFAAAVGAALLARRRRDEPLRRIATAAMEEARQEARAVQLGRAEGFDVDARDARVVFDVQPDDGPERSRIEGATVVLGGSLAARGRTASSVRRAVAALARAIGPVARDFRVNVVDARTAARFPASDLDAIAPAASPGR